MERGSMPTEARDQRMPACSALAFSVSQMTRPKPNNATTTSRTAADLEDTLNKLPPLPAPQDHKMGKQWRYYTNPFSFYRLNQEALARGNNRFLMCSCGWIVQLNQTGKAHARKTKPKRRQHTDDIGRHNPRSACINHRCTKKLAHRTDYMRLVARQIRYRQDVIEGRAVLVRLI